MTKIFQMSAGYILVEADTSAKLEQPIPGKWNSGLSTNLVSRFITAIGNFSIQYNFQAISVCLMIMSVEQCTSTEEMCKQGKQAHWVMGTAAATVFAGAILGQLTVSYQKFQVSILLFPESFTTFHRWATLEMCLTEIRQ